MMAVSDMIGRESNMYKSFMKWYDGLNPKVNEPEKVQIIEYNVMDMIFDMNLESMSNCTF